MKRNGNSSKGNGCVYFKDCLKLNIPLFLICILRKLKFQMSMADICPPPIVISQVTRMIIIVT